MSTLATANNCATSLESHRAIEVAPNKLWSNLTQICELLEIPAPPNAPENERLFQHLRFKAGQRIHCIGQAFEALYIVNSGFLKTVHVDDFGNEQVLGFPMRGELLGIDAIHTQRYASEAMALSDCDIIVLPYKIFTSLARIHQELELALPRVMSREIVREQGLISMLSGLSAEARVARFLTNLGERFQQMGYSSRCFNLRMTRQEIGSYLGLTLETVSRTLSALNELGMITVEQRQIVLLDIAGLKNLRRLPPNKAKSKVTEKMSALVNKNLLPHWGQDLATV
ncbi:MAG: helix-turn-helix domain-containing protein [Undibacterium sp.]|nr:helix-turn-helix domain-containing protein [Undibacterium sp.]